jgi:uncharacterized protein
MLEDPIGVPQDYAKAREWYEKAATAGSTLAMNNLGSMYESGQGVPQEYAKAREWYEKAADAGNGTGMSNIGALYYYGHGVPQDYTKARQWWEMAVAAGNGEARAYSRLAGELNDGRGGPVDYPRVAKLLLQSAKQEGEYALKVLRGPLSEWNAATRRELQSELAHRGYYTGPVDGVWGDSSRAALESYLKAP